MLKVIGVAIIFVLFGSGVICIGLDANKDKENWEKWPEATGTVTKFHKIQRYGKASTKSPNYSALFDIEFTVNGKLYSHKLKSSPVWNKKEGERDWAKGKTFTLKYNPDNPSDFLIKSDLSTKGAGWILITFGIVFIAFISYVLWGFISD